MPLAQSSSLTPETLTRLAQILGSFGVVGNEDDWHFDSHDLPRSQYELETLLREAGYTGTNLRRESLTRPHNGVDTIIYDPARYENSAAAEDAWERDYRKRWHDRIQHRVEDWLDRLNRLRSNIADWLKDTPDLSSLTIADRPSAMMSEELMIRFGVAPIQMPVFEIRKGEQRLVRFQPKGLWIIGANGRVDLVTRNAAPILVDQSEPLASRSDWRMYDSRKAVSVPFSRQTFVDLVRAALQ